MTHPEAGAAPIDDADAATEAGDGPSRSPPPDVSPLGPVRVGRIDRIDRIDRNAGHRWRSMTRFAACPFSFQPYPDSYTWRFDSTSSSGEDSSKPPRSHAPEV